MLINFEILSYFYFRKWWGENGDWNRDWGKFWRWSETIG